MTSWNAQELRQRNTFLEIYDATADVEHRALRRQNSEPSVSSSSGGSWQQDEPPKAHGRQDGAQLWQNHVVYDTSSSSMDEPTHVAPAPRKDLVSSTTEEDEPDDLGAADPVAHKLFETMTDAEVTELRERIPLDESGYLTSLGSIACRAHALRPTRNVRTPCSATTATSRTAGATASPLSLARRGHPLVYSGHGSAAEKKHFEDAAPQSRGAGTTRRQRFRHRRRTAKSHSCKDVVVSPPVKLDRRSLP